MRSFHLFCLALVMGCTLALLAPGAAGAQLDGVTANEETGIEAAEPARMAQPAGRPDVDVLLIPDSGSDFVGMYDPFDGTFLGDLITENPGFATPINAIAGPDGNIYVSDQVADAVFVFNRDGNYLYTYADATDGLNNIRGIEFRGNELFVTSGDDYVARFDGPHSRLPDFIADGTDPFDVLFLADGSLLLADIQGSTDNVRYYDAEGVFQYELFSVNFPEQLQTDPLVPGEFLNAAFSENVVTDFDLDGTVHQTWFFNSGRGVYRLGNGNLLLTAGDGVWEMDPATGELIDQKATGSARFIELLPALTSSIEPGGPMPRLAFRASRTLTSRDVVLRFELPQASRVEMDAYDVGGRHLARLQEGHLASGPHELLWRPGGETASASNGLFFIRLTAGEAQAVQRVIVTR
jgi:hypothetical protein